jgi:glycosyltransferase 2 family protein
LKRRTIAAVILLIIALLFWREATAWARFDWAAFLKTSRRIRIAPAVFAVVLIYLGYLLRALRWKVLVRPLKSARILPLLRTTIIGFAALAMLGRSAEFVRPYLISREEAVSMASQVAIWTLERFFDLGAAAILIAAAILVSPELKSLPYVGQFRHALWLAGGLIVLTMTAMFLLWRFRSKLSFRQSGLGGRGTRVMLSLERGLHSFSEGLQGLRSPVAFISAAALSLLMWLAIALAYLEVVHACPFPLAGMSFPAVLLLMGFSLVGSLVQLPGGGAAQLMVIAALSNVFAVPVELAVVCGILLWLATYMAPLPVGLMLLRKEHFSLSSIATASTEVTSPKAAS